MDEVLNYMVNKTWEKDEYAKRKVSLIKLAQKDMQKENISSKIGSMLIYNQVIEQMLKEVIICSISYVKAEIWPSSMRFNIDFKKATFGTLINYFKNYAVKENNMTVIMQYLNELLKFRNQIVHQLFEVKDIIILKKDLIDFGDKSYEVFLLLNEYYDNICWRLYDLNNRVDFSLFEKEEVDKIDE